MGPCPPLDRPVIHFFPTINFPHNTFYLSVEANHVG